MLTIAAIVPTYNRAHSVAETVESILSQEQQPEEVIVVDDGSSDNTDEVLRTFGERISVVRQSNAGVAAARNAGAARARSQWLAFCDSDDVWCAGRMRRLRQDLAKSPEEIVAHVGDVRFVGHGPARKWFEFLDAQIGPGETRIESRPLKVFLHSFSPIGAAVRREVFIELGGFDVSFKTDEDSELGHRLAGRGSFMICGDVMAEARRQPGDPIALSSARRKDPATALAFKEEQFRRILRRTEHQGDKKLAQAALSACLRQRSVLIGEGLMEGQRLGALKQSIVAHHNPLKAVALAAKSLIAPSLASKGFDRT